MRGLAPLPGVWDVDGVAAVGLPSGTVTFLFTDVEGSTSLWATDAEARMLAPDSDMAIPPCFDARARWTAPHPPWYRTSSGTTRAKRRRADGVKSFSTRWDVLDRIPQRRSGVT